MIGHADTLSQFQIGQIVDPNTGNVNISIKLVRDRWHVILREPYQDGLYWEPGMVLPVKEMLLTEFLQRFESTLGIPNKAAA